MPAAFASLPILGLTLIVLGALSPVPAYAHKVNMFAHVEGNRVVVEGYFSDGKPAENSQIQVFSPEGDRLIEGKTDEDGIFYFDFPQMTDLRISLYAGMGHRAEYILPATELVSTVGGGAENQPSADGVDEAGGNATTAPEVEAIVRQAVSEALTPVMRNLSEIKERRTISDIIGGIGFIVGIIGVIFYLKARKAMSKSATGA